MILSLRDQLVRDEGGYQRFVYNDSVGIPTIGVGRNLRDKGISHEESDFLLDHDITESAAEVSAEIPWSVTQLDEIRREVLINMTFNLGIAGLLKFVKFLAALQKGDHALAAKEMLDSKWAKQVGARATRLSQQMILGVRQ